MNLFCNRRRAQKVSDDNSDFFPSFSLTLGFLAAHLSNNHDKLLKLFIVSSEKNFWVFEHAVHQEVILVLGFFHVVGEW